MFFSFFHLQKNSIFQIVILKENSCFVKWLLENLINFYRIFSKKLYFFYYCLYTYIKKISYFRYLQLNFYIRFSKLFSFQKKIKRPTKKNISCYIVFLFNVMTNIKIGLSKNHWYHWRNIQKRYVFYFYWYTHHIS